MSTSSYTRTTIVVLIILGIVILVVAWFTYETVTERRDEASAAGQAILGGEDSPGRYVALGGTPVSLGDYIGTTKLYVNSWASWSPLSRDELIALNELAGEYRDRGITFIALNRKEPKEQAERYLASLPPLDNLTIVIDTEDHFYSRSGGYAMPETITYDTDGNLISHERIPQNKDQIRVTIEALIAAE
jgi:thiol-disulfide isomerase/thioredoxin